MKKMLALLSFCLTMAIAYGQKDDLTQFTGTYKFPDGNDVPSVEVTVQNEQLLASSSIGSAPMPRVNKDTFNIPEYYNALVYFIRDGQGKVVRIHIEANGNTVEGIKQGGSIAFYNRKRLIPAKAK